MKKILTNNYGKKQTVQGYRQNSKVDQQGKRRPEHYHRLFGPQNTLLNKPNTHFSQVHMEYFLRYIRVTKNLNTLRETTNPQICVK